MICNQLISLKMIKRTEGKNNSNFKTDLFYSEYKNHVKEPLSKKDFSNVRDELYSEISNVLYNEGQFKFPFKFGTLKIEKRKRKIAYNADGTINKIGYKVDWKKTKDYWGTKYPGLSQEELKQIKGKVKIYCESEWRLSIKYDKTKALYINKNFIWFRPSRTLARGLKTFVDNNPQIDYKEK